MGLERRVCITPSGLKLLWKAVDIHLNLIPQPEDFTAFERMSDREKSISLVQRTGACKISRHTLVPLVWCFGLF